MAKQRKRYSIDRRDHIERTVVGVDGRKHVYEGDKKGSSGHFTDEGEYRRAIEKAVKQNSRN